MRAQDIRPLRDRLLCIKIEDPGRPLLILDRHGEKQTDSSGVRLKVVRIGKDVSDEIEEGAVVWVAQKSFVNAIRIHDERGEAFRFFHEMDLSGIEVEE